MSMKEIFDEYNRILIYGTGLIAEKITKSFLQDKLVGIIDRFEVYGEKFGLKIYEWFEIDRQMADAIIVAAPTQYIKEIYLRILPYCVEKGIAMLSADGQDLQQYFGVGNISNIGARRVTNIEDLRRLIDSHEVISFDVFDTLITRSVEFPIDIYRILEDEIQVSGFHKYRRHAELLCADGDIYEIYELVRQYYGWSKEYVKRIIEREIEIEKKYLVVKKDVFDVYRYAQSNGKHIVLTTDMYLPNHIIKNMLERFGYSCMEKIYVSCEYKKGKNNGLFAEIKKDYPNERVLHIGDTELSDMIKPTEYGIMSAGIWNSDELLRKSPIGRYIGCVKTINDSLMIGKIQSEIFNSPFDFGGMAQQLSIDSLRKLELLFVKPLILKYFETLLSLINSSEYDGILFLARDGYILYKCYERLAQNNLVPKKEAKYILCSRCLAIRSGVENEKDIEVIMDYYRKEKLSDMACKLFGVSGINLFTDKNEDYLEACKKILAHSELTRKSYVQYLNKCGIDFNKKYVVCELDGHGTSAFFLNRMFARGISPLYLERSHEQEEYEIDATAPFHIYDREKHYSSIYIHIPMLETVFTSSSPTVKDMTGDETIFGEDKRSDSQIAFTERMHETILRSIVQDYSHVFVNSIGSLSNRLVEGLFEIASESEFVGECENFINCIMHDDIRNTTIRVFQ